jgi:hydrogenase maturation protease
VIALEACIIGAGNRWREDDGVGLVIIDKLKTLIHREMFDILWIEERLFELQSCFAVYSKLIIVDALPPGSEPGKMKIRRVERSNLKIGNAYSLHDLDLLWQIQYAFISGYTGELMLIGIEAGTMGYGEGLSPELKAVLPGLIPKAQQRVYEFLKK